MIAFVALLLLISVCTGYAVKVALRLRRLTSKSCSALINGMRYIDMTEVSSVARRVQWPLDEEGQTTNDLIERLGGSEGLRRLHHNAGAMMDIARYLILMDPQAYDLAHLIREDAVRVRRTARLLCWQQKLQMKQLFFVNATRDMARLYVTLSVNTMTLCSRLVDEVLPLLQEVSNVQSGMIRVGGAK